MQYSLPRPAAARRVPLLESEAAGVSEVPRAKTSTAPKISNAAQVRSVAAITVKASPVECDEGGPSKRSFSVVISLTPEKPTAMASVSPAQTASRTKDPSAMESSVTAAAWRTRIKSTCSPPPTASVLSRRATAASPALRPECHQFAPAPGPVTGTISTESPPTLTASQLPDDVASRAGPGSDICQRTSIAAPWIRARNSVESASHQITVLSPAHIVVTAGPGRRPTRTGTAPMCHRHSSSPRS